MGYSSVVSQNIKNFVQGVSQQPPILRFPEQLEEQINGFSTEVDGLQKRVPSVHLNTLTGLGLGKGSKPLVHFINRDKTEKYMVVFANNTVNIFDLLGNSKTVTVQEDASYLTTSTPRDTLRIMTVADYTFVLNNSVTTAVSSALSPNYFDSQGSMLYVKQGQYGRTFKVWLDGKQVCSHTTPDGSQASQTSQIDTTYIADQINSQLNTNGVATDHQDNWIRIKSNGLIQTADGFNNQALIHFKKSIQRFNLLPVTAPDNYCVKVNGDPSGDSAGSYYVKFDATNSVWVECPCPNIHIALDASTMPHIIVRNADGTFTFKRATWDERKVGDDDSNPYPSFVGHTLSSIFFFRNRLGVSSNENVILSESASYFNMWMTTANDVLDTDCIDVSVTSTKANLINYMAIFSEDLYAFSNDTQFIMRADSVLSPKSSSFAEITQFNSSPDCQPQVAGKNMYFPSERGDFASIKEYYTVQDISQMKNAQNITAHIPNYIPSGVYEIIPSTSENILFCLTNGDTDTLYIYKYLFSDESRVQSSWSKWIFDGEIYGGGFIGACLYLLLQRGSQVTLEVLDFSVDIRDFEATEKYRVYLDQKKVLTGGVFDNVYQTTKFNLRNTYGYTDNTALNHICVITDKGRYIPELSVDSSGCITLEGDYSGKNLIVGEKYTFEIQFTTFYIKQNNNGNISSESNGRTQVKYLHIQYDHSGYFEVLVSFKDGRSYSYQMTSKMIGDQTAILGALVDDTGIFKCPVHAKNDSVTIKLQSDMPLPVAIIGLTWDCTYITKTKGV